MSLCKTCNTSNYYSRHKRETGKMDNKKELIKSGKKEIKMKLHEYSNNNVFNDTNQ